MSNEANIYRRGLHLVGCTILELVRALLAFIGGALLFGVLIWRLLCLGAPLYQHGVDLSWKPMAPLYALGINILVAGLVVIRGRQMRDEWHHGIDPGCAGDDSDIVRKWKWLLRDVPPVGQRSECYLWVFTLLGAILTFVLRDQALNWMIESWGLFDVRVIFWDTVSLIAAPLTGVLLAMRGMAIASRLCGTI